MRILESRQVLVHHVQFSDEETAILKELGWIPASIAGPVELRLQDEQVEEWERILVERIPYPHNA